MEECFDIPNIMEENEEDEAMQRAIQFSLKDQHSTHLPPIQELDIQSDIDVVLDREDDINHETETGVDNSIVVDNLPVVGSEKYKKLKRVVSNTFSKEIGVIKEDMIYMPVNIETQETLGYCFIEYNIHKEAEIAKNKRDGYSLDKRHKLSVKLLNEFDRALNVADEWTPPETKPYICRENLQQWLTDEKAREQFLIRADFDIEVFWNGTIQLKPELVHVLDYDMEGVVQWSPLGTYLTAIDRQGVTVWGGATTLNRLNCYIHPEVKLIDFSPAEKYLVTFSCHEPKLPQGEYNVLLNIFDVSTGKVKERIVGSPNDFGISDAGDDSEVPWPLIRWSSGNIDKYFAGIWKNMIYVYETETFSLIKKTSLGTENVKDFSWSPADPIIAVFVPELDGGLIPARVSLIHIPSKQELRQKIFLNVSDCQMYWQNNGDYLAIKVESYTKTKKRTYPALELFRLRERDILVEALELEHKSDRIIAFSWEPKGHRFAVMHGDIARPDISFYSMVNASNKGNVSKLTTLGKKANALYWSPAGRFVILAGLIGLNGQMEFYDVDELQTIAMAEHYMVTNVTWDPTGRYVATSANSANGIENGFNIWSFYGKLLYKIPMEHLSQFSWRPRPPSLLSAEKEEEIKKNLKKYSMKYKAEDKNASIYLSEQKKQRRKWLMEEWNKWVLEWKWLHEEEKVYRCSLRDGEATEEEEDNEIEEVECDEVLNVVKEIVSFLF